MCHMLKYCTNTVTPVTPALILLPLSQTTVTSPEDQQHSQFPFTVDQLLPQTNPSIPAPVHWRVPVYFTLFCIYNSFVLGSSRNLNPSITAGFEYGSQLHSNKTFEGYNKSNL
jgi:hypothetical protein